MRALQFSLLILFLVSTLPAVALEPPLPPEVEWAATIEKILADMEKENSDAESKKAAAEIRALLTAPRKEFDKGEKLEGEWKVRSLQASNLGAYSYPYFGGRIYKEGQALMFHKNSGSQRKIGVLKEESKARYDFLGSEYVHDEKPTTHSSSLMKEPTDKDKERDCAGALLKLGKNRCLIIFAPKTGRGEIYELKR